MKNLLLNSLVCLVFIGCNYGHYRQLKPYASVNSEKPVELHPIFKDSFNSFLFKTNIQLYTKDFSGLLITKQTAQENYRVVFTTEIGMTLFDFEFRDTAFTVHYCMEQFNRPYILKTIKKDIEILLMNGLHKSSTTLLADRKNNYTITRTIDNDAFNYYFCENSSKQLVKIEHAGKRKKKTSFTLDNYIGNFPNHVFIRHHDFNLKIELNLLKK